MNEMESDIGGSFTKRTYKIVLMGEMQTGKSSIINRFTANKFKDRPSARSQ